MKKIISIFITAAMLLAFASCGSLPSVSKTNEQNNQPTAKQTANNTDEPISDTPKSGDKTKETEPKTAKTEPVKKIDYTIDNEIIVDNENCKVTIVNATAKNSGVDFKFTLDNKTSDKVFMFSIDNTAVNARTISSLFA